MFLRFFEHIGTDRGSRLMPVVINSNHIMQMKEYDPSAILEKHWTYLTLSTGTNVLVSAQISTIIKHLEGGSNDSTDYVDVKEPYAL